MMLKLEILVNTFWFGLFWGTYLRETCHCLTNINSGFLFVTRQDPYLYIGLHQSLDGLGHFILKLVLDRCGPEQLQVLRQKLEKGSERRSQPEKCLYNIMCQRNMRVRTVSLIQSCFPSSAAVYHAQNHNRLSGVARVCVCVHLQTPPLPSSQGHTILSVFFFSAPGILVVLWS